MAEEGGFSSYIILTFLRLPQGRTAKCSHITAPFLSSSNSSKSSPDSSLMSSRMTA